MLVKNDQVVVAVKLVSDEGIDQIKVAQFLELLTTFFRLAIAVMLTIASVINALDAWTAAFWRAWDTAVIGLRWYLFPVRIVAMG